MNKAENIIQRLNVTKKQEKELIYKWVDLKIKVDLIVGGKKSCLEGFSESKELVEIAYNSLIDEVNREFSLVRAVLGSLYKGVIW